MAQSMDVKVAENGRMVLPLSVRRAMGLIGDTKVVLTLEDDQVRLSPVGHGVTRVQAIYRQHMKGRRSTDDFLADRRDEVAREDRELK